MPDLNSMNKFIKVKNLQEGDRLKFLDAGKIKDVDFSPKKDGSKIQKVFESTVSLNDSEAKIIALNKASRDNLIKAWGSKTEEWIDKTAVVKYVKMIVFGELQDVLCLEPMAWDE